MEETTVDSVTDASINSTDNGVKRKCLTHSEYHAMNKWIDSLINDTTTEFILNKYNYLKKEAFNKYTHLNENTVQSIVDARVQYYVRKRHHRVFTNAPYATYNKYKALVSSVKSPLVDLANKLRMPAMLVAKVVLTEHKQELKQNMEFFNTSESLNSSNISTDSSPMLNRSNKQSTFDTSLDVDVQLSEELDWLSKKIISMRKVLPITNSNNCNSYCLPKINNSLCFTPHQLATSTWLIRTDPHLAYQVFICSLIDSYYGPCIEFIKSCIGKQFEQILTQCMTCITTGTKSQKNNPEKMYLFTTEKGCRLRGLDMTPDMVLYEPIAISLSDDHSMNNNQEHIATNYVGVNDNAVRVLNWIESKAMFGGPDQLRTVMQRQLFPYWNRYGPGAVIYWFGHVLEDGEKYHGIHTSVSVNQPTTGNVSAASVNSPSKVDSLESDTFNFWSKYCLLMDGFPASSKIVMHNHWNKNR